MSTPPPPPPPPPPSNPENSPSSVASLIRTILSYDTNIMLAAIISLLLVILFVLLLHLYTRWFLLQARRRSHTSVTVPHVLGSGIQHRFTIIDNSNSGNSPDFDCGLECAICLNAFEEEEIGRKLPDCGHAFHVECVDMWLHSHSTCPICRAAIQCNYNHNRKIDQLEIEIVDPDQNEEELRSEIVTVISDQISEPNETADIMAEDDDGGGGAPASSSSSSIGESIKKFLSNSSSCSSRSGGKIHPSSIANGDESDV